MARELVLDTETTGLDPKDNHRVIELACIELVNYIPTGTYWHWYFNPERDVPKQATDVHGLTNAFLADKPRFLENADEIASVLEGARLIIHNAAFDVKFLNHEFGKTGHPAIDFERVVDTLSLARRKHPGSPNSLDALCRRYGVNNSARKKHGALLDSELLADVYLKLIGAEQAGLNFATTSRIGDPMLVTSSVVKARENPLASRISGADLATHRAFVETLGENAMWLTYQQECA